MAFLTKTVIKGDFFPGYEALVDNPQPASEKCQIHFDNSILHDLFPIGSVQITLGDTNPGLKFGGTWQKISTSKYIKPATNQNNSIGDDGTVTIQSDGRSSFTIEEANLPGHTHTVAAKNLNVTISNNGAHYHAPYNSATHYLGYTLEKDDELHNETFGGSLSGSGYKMAHVKSGGGFKGWSSSSAGSGNGGHSHTGTAAFTASTAAANSAHKKTAISLNPECIYLYFWIRVK